jgi:hypothetical protein
VVTEVWRFRCYSVEAAVKPMIGHDRMGGSSSNRTEVQCSKGIVVLQRVRWLDTPAM